MNSSNTQYNIEAPTVLVIQIVHECCKFSLGENRVHVTSLVLKGCNFKNLFLLEFLVSNKNYF